MGEGRLVHPAQDTPCTLNLNSTPLPRIHSGGKPQSTLVFPMVLPFFSTGLADTVGRDPLFQQSHFGEFPSPSLGRDPTFVFLMLNRPMTAVTRSDGDD